MAPHALSKSKSRARAPVRIFCSAVPIKATLVFLMMPLELSKQQAIPNLSDLAAGVSGQSAGMNRHIVGSRYGVLASHLKRKSYSGLSPVVDSLLGISTEAVFLLTRNCSSKFRALICLMKDRFFRSPHPASQTVLEKRA
jgi:hypothetical protein